MRILITGGEGQLARELSGTLSAHETFSPGRTQLDITDPRQVRDVVGGWHPDVIINTAAFNAVDLCEEEPEQCFAINAVGPQRLAAAARDHDAVLMHISTDYVFNGETDRPYEEDDPIDPVSVYGASKAAGELSVRCTTDRHFVVRTTGLYGFAGRTTRHGNLVETMLRLAGQRKPLTVVCDQVLTPTSTADLAEVIARLIETNAFGTYHVTNGGLCSWYEFAVEIFRLARLDVDVTPVPQAERPAPARRPTYSVLAHRALLGLDFSDLRPWQEALEAYLRDRASL